MMGEQKSEPLLFNYAVNLEKRVRVGHPLRQVKAATRRQTPMTRQWIADRLRIGSASYISNSLSSVHSKLTHTSDIALPKCRIVGHNRRATTALSA
jgi:hypothetical protein